MENTNESTPTENRPENSSSPSEPVTKINLKKVFATINEFVVNAYEQFGSQLEPANKEAFKMYFELIKRVTTAKDPKESEQLTAGIIYGFNEFFSEILGVGKTSSKFLEVASLLAVIPKKSIIKYKKSDKLFIPISSIIRKADDETKLVLGQYLYTIEALTHPTKEKINQLAVIKKSKPRNPLTEMLGIEEGSDQANFMSEILNDVVKTIDESGMDPNTAMDGNNLPVLLMSLYSSGAISKLKDGFESGKIVDFKDPKSVNNMKNMMKNFIDKIPVGEQTETEF